MPWSLQGWKLIHGLVSRVFEFLIVTQDSLGAQRLKKKIHLPMQEIRVQCLVREDPLEEGMATHCSTPAWRIPWIEEPGRATVSGVARFWATKQQQRVTHLCLGASASFTKRVSKSSSLSSCSNNLSTQTVVLRTQRIDTNISESEWGPEVTQTAFFAGGEKKACGLFFLWINNTVREAYEFKKKKKKKRNETLKSPRQQRGQWNRFMI